MDVTKLLEQRFKNLTNMIGGYEDVGYYTLEEICEVFELPAVATRQRLRKLVSEKRLSSHHDEDRGCMLYGPFKS